MLKSIKSPADIKRFTAPNNRRQLAHRDPRKDQGHRDPHREAIWPPIWGRVELSIAVHTVYDAPKDLIVLDTGHQETTPISC